MSQIHATTSAAVLVLAVLTVLTGKLWCRCKVYMHQRHTSVHAERRSS